MPRVRLLKDVTLVLNKGQEIDLDDKKIVLLPKFNYELVVEEVKKPTKKTKEVVEDKE
jgi:hypothetical protein